ncbi:hypothetical protein [Sediminibacterium sp.]|uniref:hypothetical protein n=1 Tax=Sediminibacterium sp. TaxID=1917865 RepID=UPI003F70CB6F
MINKEYGSDFHYFLHEDIVSNSIEDSIFHREEFSLFFSGRAALFHIISQGIKLWGWKKVYFPSFYCHEVPLFIKSLSVQILYYNYNPFVNSTINFLDIEDIDTNVFINVFFFGVRKIDHISFNKTVIIEDCTHSILSFQNSKADYCFGSLRKELPLPAGGFCISPKMKPLPKGTLNINAEKVAGDRLLAMQLKNEYLDGTNQDKSLYRKLFTESEKKFQSDFTNAKMPNCAYEILLKINAKKVLKIKENNIKTALEQLSNIKDVIINFQSSNCDVFGLCLEFKTTIIKNKFKDYLIENNIFPAVLWPNQIWQEDIDVENRILFIHLDYRYNQYDVLIITKLIKEYFVYVPV